VLRFEGCTNSIWSFCSCGSSSHWNWCNGLPRNSWTEWCQRKNHAVEESLSRKEDHFL
jgi:hypothetical protein